MRRPRARGRAGLRKNFVILAAIFTVRPPLPLPGAQGEREADNILIGRPRKAAVIPHGLFFQNLSEEKLPYFFVHIPAPFALCI